QRCMVIGAKSPELDWNKHVSTLNRLAEAYDGAHDSVQCQTVLLKLVNVLRAYTPEDEPRRMEAMRRLASNSLQLRRFSDAQPPLTELIGVYEGKPQPQSELVDCYSDLALTQLQLHQSAEAEKNYKVAMKYLKTWYRRNSPKMADVLEHYADLLDDT